MPSASGEPRGRLETTEKVAISAISRTESKGKIRVKNKFLNYFLILMF